MKFDELRAIETLRQSGHAVVVFEKSKLRSMEAYVLEAMLYELAHEELENWPEEVEK